MARSRINRSYQCRLLSKTFSRARHSCHVLDGHTQCQALRSRGRRYLARATSRQSQRFNFCQSASRGRRVNLLVGTPKLDEMNTASWACWRILSDDQQTNRTDSSSTQKGIEWYAGQSKHGIQKRLVSLDECQKMTKDRTMRSIVGSFEHAYDTTSEKGRGGGYRDNFLLAHFRFQGAAQSRRASREFHPSRIETGMAETNFSLFRVSGSAGQPVVATILTLQNDI